MTNSKTLFKDFINSLTLNESYAEIESITYLTFEHLFGLSKAQILAGKELVDGVSRNRLQEIVARLNQHEPIQYILGEALFFGRTFRVNRSVLIPRPETEDLVRLVLDHLRKKNTKSRIVDLGTGSGCIAITLSLELPGSEILATDVSPEALTIAAENAQKLNAAVYFEQHDILRNTLNFSADVIVSNPPYISTHERHVMAKNVVDFEPDVALFVNDDDPFVFYRAIISNAEKLLVPGGLLAVEINERYGNEILELFNKQNFRDTDIVNDIYGKNRIVKGILS
jgi:release factor glutamine methyltransferase